MSVETMSNYPSLDQLRIDIAYYKARLADLEREPDSHRPLQGKDWLLQQLQCCEQQLRQLEG